MTTDTRLARLEHRAARRPRSRFDWSRLTDDERREFAALQDRTRRLGGVGFLSDDEVERAAALAERMLIAERRKA
jgi:hypothetical protein